MARIELKHGTEGPRHDPYAYTEYHFTHTDGTEIVAHLGLACWLRVAGHTLVEYDDKLVASTFEEIIGLPLHKLQRAYSRIQYTCKKCGCRSTHEVPGYPGEYLNVCDNCDSIVSTDFNLSEIE